MQMMINLPQILVMAFKTIQPLSVLNLKSFGPMKKDLWAKEVREVCITLYGKIGWWAFFCLPTWLPQCTYMEIF